jgi:hypothetical protein
VLPQAELFYLSVTTEPPSSIDIVTQLNVTTNADDLPGKRMLQMFSYLHSPFGRLLPCPIDNKLHTAELNPTVLS